MMVHLVNHQVIGSIPTLSSQPNLSVGQLVAYSPWKRDVGGSSPPTQTKAIITQLVEYLPCKQEVIGSSPIDSTSHTQVAQLVEAMVLEAIQCGFESHLAHQQKYTVMQLAWQLVLQTSEMGSKPIRCTKELFRWTRVWTWAWLLTNV